jgi:site-specific recombinase XerD
MSGTRRKPGVMGPHIGRFERWLLDLGYTPSTVRNMLKEVGHLGRWMTERGLPASQLGAQPIAEFVFDQRLGDRHRKPTVRSFLPLLDFLRCEGLLVPIEVTTPTPLEALIDEYCDWLVHERGLAAPTVLRYENLARRFLEERLATVGSRVIEGLTGADVVGFLLAETARVSVGAAKGRVAELRSLLRFLYLKGLTPLALAAAVPPVAGWHDTGVPVGLTPHEVQRLLDCCNRSDPAGVRDFAILMLVARLGLRSAEVARLELGDIEWRAGEIVVRGKARRRDRLPLVTEAGEALSAYLSLPRRSTTLRQVFLATRAPTRAIRPDLVSDVCRRACARADVPRVGAHRLRHALATEMLAKGATLGEVSQVLRHRDLATTAIYAKVDYTSLVSVAQPWPGSGR